MGTQNINSFHLFFPFKFCLKDLQCKLHLSLRRRYWNWLYKTEGVSDSKESTCRAKVLGSIPGSGISLEKGMATYSSILAWRIPWTKEPGRLQSMGLQRVGHDWATNFHFHTMWNRRWNSRNLLPPSQGRTYYAFLDIQIGFIIDDIEYFRI